jgi:uncharacterized membrane protein
MPNEPRPDDDTDSRVAIADHPIHAMVVNFPITLLTVLVVSDLGWVISGDPFWARLSLWLVGGGAVMGLFAGLIGTLELLLIPGVRRRGASWNHFIVATMLISVAFTNWFLRLAGPADMIVPWGMSLSLLGALLVMIAGWLGASLVFDHKIGIVNDDGD